MLEPAVASSPEVSALPEPFASSPAEPARDARTPEEPEDEAARLEKLLAQRAREARELRRELDRRSALLREALWRIGSKVAEEASVLRRERETALARALEAEVARAEIGFRLDEALGQLEFTLPAGPVRDLRKLQARVAELEELDAALRARLLLAEQDLDGARASTGDLRRQIEERSEDFELALVRARAEAELESARAQSADQRSRGLHGERDGYAARCAETERALTSASARLSQAERVQRDTREKLEGARADAAELAVAAQARAAHVSELGRELSREQQEVRVLRAQLEAAIAAQRSERSARDADVQGWMERLHELEAKQRSGAGADAAPQGWASELRAFLATLRQPLLQLTAALDNLEQGSASAGIVRAEAGPDDTSPGSEAALSAMTLLEDRVRSSEARVLELEQALAAAASAPSRDATILALKGELIDTRANAQRVADDLTKERARRRRLSVTVRALQAALETGEAAGPWIDELITVLNEGASIPPR